MVRRSRLSDLAICSLYRDQHPRSLISLKAGIPDYEVVGVLVRNGVPLRHDAEARAIAIRNRERYKSTQRARLEGARLRRKKQVEEEAA